MKVTGKIKDIQLLLAIPMDTSKVKKLLPNTYLKLKFGNITDAMVGPSLTIDDFSMDQSDNNWSKKFLGVTAKGLLNAAFMRPFKGWLIEYIEGLVKSTLNDYMLEKTIQEIQKALNLPATETPLTKT